MKNLLRNNKKRKLNEMNFNIDEASDKEGERFDIDDFENLEISSGDKIREQLRLRRKSPLLWHDPKQRRKYYIFR